MGVLPALYPRELLWAHDILPAEIWDPPGELNRANAHLQPTICPVVKRSLEFMLATSDIVNTGYLIPHTCDSLQNLATLTKDLIRIHPPIRTFYNPKGPFTQNSEAFYRQQLKGFEQALAAEFGPLNPEKLTAACELSQRMDTVKQQLARHRSRDELQLSNRNYFRLIRAGEFMVPEEYIALLEDTISSRQNPMGSRIKIMVSGILPPDDELLELLDATDVVICAEDLLCGNRRVPLDQVDLTDDPLRFITDRTFSLPPCSTKANSLQERAVYLNKLAVDAEAHGILFNLVKFCEPELFDHQALVKHFKQCGYPALSIETELGSRNQAQLLTRLEAFLEMLSQDRAV